MNAMRVRTACVAVLLVAAGTLRAGQSDQQPGILYQVYGDAEPDSRRYASEVRVRPDLNGLDWAPHLTRQLGWGLRCTGLLTPPADGEFVFRAEADTGVRLKLDGIPVIDGWAADGARTGKATLKKGSPAAIVVDYYFQGGKKAELRLFWTPPGGKEAPVPATAFSQPLMVDATLARVSKAPTLADIAPYRDALVMYEYTANNVPVGSLPAKTIRVAHWGIYDRQEQDVLVHQPGQRCVLTLLPFDRVGAFVQQAKMSDTLDEKLDAPIYFDLGQRLVCWSDRRAGSRWDYGTSWSEKMGWFFPVHGQLRLVALADSRAVAGVDTKCFFQPENLSHPVAFNLAIVSSGVDTMVVAVREYAMRLPKLKWIVWGISPRMFNSRWADVMKGMLTGSPGYQYDRANPELVWKKGSEGMVMLTQRPTAAGDGDAWGFKELSFPGDPRGNFKAPGTQKMIQGLLENPGFAYAQDRMQRFADLLRELEARNIRVLGFIPPQHRFTKGQPCTDDTGTTREGYDQIVAALSELARSRRNFVFLDIDRKGENDFKDEDFANFDHLNGKGAAKLTQMLDRAIAEAGKTGSKTAGSPPKER